MTRTLATWMTALIVIAQLALPARAAAQQPKSRAFPYTLIDLGTFGGLQSTIAGPSVQLLNSQGMVGGVADTTIPDADYPTFNPSNGWFWDRGTLRDLNSLVAPSVVHLSQAQFITDRAEIACYGVLPNGTYTRCCWSQPVWRRARDVQRASTRRSGTCHGDAGATRVLLDQGSIACPTSLFAAPPDLLR